MVNNPNLAACLRGPIPSWAPLLLLLCGVAPGASAAEPPPHLNERGLAGYAEYRAASDHKAFVIAPGGTWAWVSGKSSPDAARDAALSQCATNTEQRCTVYASNNKVVFDDDTWPTLWQLPSSTPLNPRQGIGRGQRFPDLLFRTSGGSHKRIEDYRGKVLIVHFWGSWCPPCLREFPQLRGFHQQLSQIPEADMVLLQVRESFTTAQQWVLQNGFEGVPLYDSGVGPEVSALPLASGSTLPDRYLARAFPTTYVLDQHGRVLFAHRGPIHNWHEYLPFIRHAALQPHTR